MNKFFCKRYKTTNWSDYNQALVNRGNLTIWFDADMEWKAQPSGKRGRSCTYSDAAIKCCLMIKSLFQLPLRQVSGFIQSLINLCNLSWESPDYSTLSRRQKTISISLKPSKAVGSMHLLVDSTGIKMMGEGEWKCKKHGKSYHRQWRKLHIGIDAKTMKICAAKITPNNMSYSQILPDLLNQIPAHQLISAVYGDGAYDTKGCRSAIAKRHAIAVIPPRKNAQLWKEDASYAHERNELLKTINHIGRAIWKRWAGYHQRSLVESKMACIKRLGDKLMAKDFDRQVNELMVRLAVLNKFSQLGRPHTQVVS